MSEKQERIVGASLLVSYETSDKYDNELRIDGADWGFIRGGQVYSNIRDVYGIHGQSEGFFTNKNRFVDPKEAMGIAIEAGQLSEIREKIQYGYGLAGYESYNPDTDEALEELKASLLKRGLKPEDLY
ncbi:hypothetical protein MMG00_12115 [Ignatzschineria rhizosphaerae]|uniref:Bacterial toxin 44 domain-containing protein n=1 Tax=Ignatzschineria rhizosphaerae TaxID=2923279 RepID=A0ABY3X0V0_9GAMM|nr:hypothetical protein [Ignatzschineria rhizosphaerae]UNM95930.1 hypothetical protein MMG00_12115 [Ignatzschineria rhizosphaerae]